MPQIWVDWEHVEKAPVWELYEEGVAVEQVEEETKSPYELKLDQILSHDNVEGTDLTWLPAPQKEVPSILVDKVDGEKSPV